MIERPLSNRMREDIYAGEYREAVAALEAENARLRKELMTAYASERSQERARIRREQAQTIAWMRGCIDRFGDFKQWADRLEEATRDA